jgi:hypothetical protein
MVKLEASFFWIITTRFNICNIYTESQIMRCFIKKLLASIHLPSIVVRNTKESLINSYLLPSINEIYYICHSLFSEFSSDFLSEEVKKMIAADDLQSAIEYLGGHLSDSNNLQNTILQKERDIQKRYEAKVKYYSDLGEEKKLEHYSKKLENKVNNISKLEDRIQNLTDECPICMEPILRKSDAYLTSCGHGFHKKCIFHAFQTKMEDNCFALFQCPMCRSKMGDVCIQGKYNVNSNEYNILDELENYWSKKDFTMCILCDNECDHYQGMKSDCELCIRYRKDK